MTAFGDEGASEMWGDDSGAESAAGLEEVEMRPGSHSLGNGHTFVLYPEGIHTLLHHPAAEAACRQRAQQIADMANSQIAMDPRAVARLYDGNPAYSVSGGNDPNKTRIRFRVWTSSLLGIIDERYNSTLLKSMLAHPSDPIPHTEDITSGGEE